MSSTGFTQKLFRDGVNRGDYISQRDWYVFCIECHRTFSNQAKPSLLKCGHVCCQKCQKNTYCICCHSSGKKVKKETKISDYSSLLQDQINKDQRLTNKDELKYNFSLKIGTSPNSTFALELPETTLLYDLFCMHPQFQQFEKGTKTTVVAMIKGKSFRVEEIKQKKQTIATWKSKSLLRDQSTNFGNAVMFYNRQQGGFELGSI